MTPSSLTENLSQPAAAEDFLRPIAFEKRDPGGNPTVLIDNRAGNIAAPDYGTVAQLVMQEPYLCGEQVGFVEAPSQPGSQGRMVMMGGELCINALRCYGAHLSSGRTGLYRVESSGVADMLEIDISGDPSAPLVGVRLKLTPRFSQPRPGLTMVDLPGITHFVERVEAALSLAELSARLRTLMCLPEFTARNLTAAGYMGMLWQAERWHIFPVVWVNASDSMVAETSCGSGSLAALLALAGKGSLAIRQPSGADLQCSFDGTTATVAGTVRLVARGELHLNLETDDFYVPFDV